MPKPRIALVAFASCVVLAAAVATAEAGTLAVGRGKKYETIGEAAADSKPGDRIVVSRGTYLETVILQTPRVQIVAARGTEWHPETFGGPCLVVDDGAADAAVSGFTFRGAGVAIITQAPDTSVSRCEFRACTVGIDAAGSGTRLSRLRIRTAALPVTIQGDGAVVDRCNITISTSTLLLVQGRDATVTRNSVRGAAGGEGIVVIGDDARVEGNRVWDTRAFAVHVEGSRARVFRNGVASVLSAGGILVNGNDADVTSNSVLETSDVGIRVTGLRARVVGNGVTAAGGPGIYVDGGAFEVRGNRVRETVGGAPGIHARASADDGAAGGFVLDNSVRDGGGTGYLVEGEGVRVERNVAEEAFLQGFYILGTGHEITGNSSRFAALHGFEIRATNSAVTNCVATDSGRDGFRIGGASTSLSRCSASRSAADGLHGAATGVTFSQCTFRFNRQDVAASGGTPLTDGGGNRWDTGDVDAAPVD